MSETKTTRINDAAEASIKTLHFIVKCHEICQQLRTASAAAPRRAEYREDEESRQAMAEIYDEMAMDLIDTASSATLVARKLWADLLPPKPSKAKRARPGADEYQDFDAAA